MSKNSGDAVYILTNNKVDKGLKKIIEKVTSRLKASCFFSCSLVVKR